MTPQTVPIKAQIPPKLILLSDILPSSNPINDIDWEHVERLLQAFERSDPLPPIVVFPVDGGKFELLFGQHRYAARVKGKFADILATVLPHRPTPMEALSLRFKENVNHRGLKSHERASAFFQAKELDPSLNNKGIAIIFGVSEATVSRDLNCDKNLHPTLKELIAKLKLAPKAGWAISRLPLDRQVPFYEEHAKTKAEDMADLVSEELARIEGATPKVKPVQVSTAGGLRAWLPTTAEAALAELQRLLKAVKSVSEKGGSLSDVPAWLRLNG